MSQRSAGPTEWTDEQWQAAVMHLLVCKWEISACQICQTIERQTEIEPTRTILELDRIR